VTTEAEVIVVGAGPAGAVTALVLARAGRRVLLIGTPPRRRRIGEALVGAARPLLRELELLSTVEAGPHLPCYGNTASWGSAVPVATDFIYDPNGPGWHLDRPRFDEDLRQAAVNAGANWQIGRAGAVRRLDRGWLLNVGRTRVKTQWLVDATGRGATVARRLGAKLVQDQRLTALYGWCRTSSSDRDGRSLVEAVEDGWWYTAKLPGGVRVAALHVGADQLEDVALIPTFWAEQLAKTVHVRPLIMDQEMVAAPRATEASGARLSSWSGDGWVATGDAALAFDPLSSQGIFNSIYTGMRAGQAVAAALDGDAAELAHYATRLEQIRSAYIRQHQFNYHQERRWAASPFWRGRLASWSWRS